MGEKSPTVKNAWKRLKVWCKKHLPEVLDHLNPGATPNAIRAFERAIGKPLPADVRESYALHDGQDQEGRPTGLVFGLPILPLARAMEEWRGWREFESYNEEFRPHQRCHPEGAIQLDYTNPGWVPLTLDWGGNHIGVDLAPGPKGMVGQVITFGRDENRKYVAAPSWAAFLNQVADQLEAGKLHNRGRARRCG